ncbi:MAG: T9SS type A sorting domain-containing protein [Bacteroidia bacterium]
MGAEITYDCVSGNTYEFTLRFYRDCEGITPLSSVPLTFNSASCNQSFTRNAVKEPGYPIEVSPLCPLQLPNSECNSGGTLPGVQEYVYKVSVTLPAACRDWKIGFSEGYRNASITTIDKPGSTYLYVESTLNNVDAPCNSSPDFTNIPTPFICRNQPYQYNHGAIDPEGDSLAYSLADVLNASGSAATYLSTFSGQNPVSSTLAVTLDPNNGNLSMTPTQIQVGVMAVVVKEYRNGVLIGSIMRDMQVTVLACNNTPPAIQPLTNLVGATSLGPLKVEVCPGTPVSFTVPGLDVDNNNLTLSWNGGIAGATFGFFSGTNGSVNGTFNWTPGAGSIGKNVFVVTITDDACPIVGTQALAIEIDVIGGTNAGPDQTICPGGANSSAFLKASGGSTFNWRVISGTPNSLSCTTCPNPLASPIQTTTYEVTSNFPCKPKDTVVVNTNFAYNLNTSRDTTLCSAGATVNLSATPDVPGFYTYFWSPSGTLNQSTTNNVTANPTAPTTYVVEATDLNGCKVIDSIRVDLSNNLLAAFPSSSATQYCAGEPITLFANVAGGDCNSYTAQNIPFSPTGGTGTVVTLGDDAVSGALSIGFDFEFYCNTYQNIYIGSNGWVSFTSWPDAYYDNDPIPTSTQVNNMIALAWDDLDPSSGGSIEYFTTGTAPNRKLIVNFLNIQHYNCNSCLVTSQLVLEEGSNSIELHNTRIDSDGNNATITQGIENSTGTRGVFVPGRNSSNWTANAESWRFSRAATPGTYNVSWQSPLGAEIGTSDPLIVYPNQPTTYYAVVSDLSGTCVTTATLPVNVAYVDAGPTRIIQIGDSANIDATYFGPPAQNDPNLYTLTTIPYSWTAGSGTDLSGSLGNNGVLTNRNIGFSFDFYGNTFTRFNLSADGWISFSSTGSNQYDEAIPNTNQPNNLIAFAWDNLNNNNRTDIYHFTTGTAPNRKMVLSFVDAYHYGSSSKKVTVQLVLYETTNVIEFHADEITNDGSGTLPQMTLGIENSNGTHGIGVPGKNYANNWTANNQAWRFTPPTVGLTYSWNNGGTLNTTSQEDPRASPPVDTWYTLTVDNGPCLLVDSVQVIVTPLPVTLTDFSGERFEDFVLLNWETESEISFAGFSIERSVNGMDFEEVGYVGAKGEAANYEFLDTDPRWGTQFYRLKMIDLDGKFSLSNVIEIHIPYPEYVSLDKMYPNPSKDVFNFRIYSPKASSNVRLTMIDMHGKVVQRQEKLIEGQGVHRLEANMSHYPPGIYIYILEADGKRFSGKASLVK